MGKKVIPLSDIAYFRAKFPELFGDFVYITLKFFQVNGASFSKRRGVNQDLFAVLNSSAVLDSHTRSIRNIQIVCQDLFPLVAENNTKDKRLPSTTINAFGASIQDQFDSSDEGADFCVFSSWLAVLADGKVGEKDEKNVGAFGDHVMQAVRSHTVQYFERKFSANKSVSIRNKGGNPSPNSLGHTTLFRKPPTLGTGICGFQ
jgi:hypothetical protein